MAVISFGLRASPLVGRDEELAAVDDLLRHDGAKGVVLAGAAGVGKTRLATDAADHVRATGVVVESIVATRAARSLPFGAMLPLVAAEDLEPGVGPLALYRSVRQSLEARSRDGVLVVVDDAHLLDDASAELLSHLAKADGVRLLLTVIAGEPAPDPVTRLWRDELLTRIEIQPLSAAEVGRFAAGVLGGRVESATIDRLYEVTVGNALFLREVLINALATDALSDVGGTWSWRPRGAVTTRLSDVVHERLGQLDDAVRTVLNVLALGEPLSLDDFGFVEPTLSQSAIEVAEHRDCMTIAQDGRRRQVRLAHPLYGEVARSELTRAEADRIRGQLAARVAATGARRRGDVLRRALWLLEAGVFDDARLFVAASVQARAFDRDLSIRFAKAAVVADACFDSRLALAWVHPDPTESTTLAVGLAADARDDDQIVRATDLLVSLRLFAHVDFDGAATALAEAAERVAYPSTRCHLNARRIQVLLAAGNTTNALELGRAVLDDPAAAAGARLRAAGQTTWARALGGHLSTAMAVAAREYELARNSAQKEPILCAEVLAARVVCAILAGRLSDAETEMKDLESVAQSGPNEFARGWSLLLGGRVALWRGATTDAIGLLTDAVIAHREIPNGPLGWWAAALLVEAHSLAGDTEKAQALVAELGSVGEVDYGMPAPDTMRALAWARVAAGETTAATAMFLEAADRARRRELRVLELLAVYDAVRAGLRGSVLDRLIDIAEGCDGRLARAIGAHARAMSTENAGELMQAAEELAATGMTVAAAEAAIQAADAQRSAGRRSSALMAAARARNLVAECLGVQTPIIAHAELHDAGLTPREREVVELAARGGSNRQIASQLFTSPRTVEGHLLRAFAKLGISSRRELPAALGLPPPHDI